MRREEREEREEREGRREEENTTKALDLHRRGEFIRHGLGRVVHHPHLNFKRTA
jgi:hypothetical protein